MSKLRLIFTLVGILSTSLLISCKKNKLLHHGLLDFAIGGQNQLYISYGKKDIYGIFKADHLHGKFYEIIRSDSLDHTSYTNPVLSPSGHKIGYLRFNVNSEENNIYMADTSGKGKQQLTFGHHLITSFTFLNDRTILYSDAAEFANYSPLASKAAHNCDLYLLNLKPHVITKKISDFKSYSIGGLTTVSRDTALFDMVQNPAKGIFSISFTDGVKFRPLLPEKIRNQEYAYYYSPQYNREKNFFFFASPYELHCMNKNTSKITTIYRAGNGGISDFKVVNEKNELLVMEGTKPENNSLILLNFDGSFKSHIKIIFLN